MALLLGWDGGEHLSGGVDLTQDVLPATSQLDWLISTTAMIVLSWSRATRDLLKSFGWGIGALHRLATATMVPSPRRLPHSISWSHPRATPPAATRFVADSALEGNGFQLSVPRIWRAIRKRSV